MPGLQAATPLTVVVTGSRDWTDWGVIGDRLRRLPPGSTVVHGHASRGVDKLVDKIARELGFTVVREPADWRVTAATPSWAIRRRPNGALYDVRAGRLRNVRMLVKYQPHLVLGFRLNGSPGTTHCLEEARARGIPTEVTDR